MSTRPIRRTYLLEGRALEAELHASDGRILGQVAVAGEPVALDAAARRLDPHRVEFEHDGRRVRATVVRDGDVAWVSIEGRSWQLKLEEPGAGGVQARQHSAPRTAIVGPPHAKRERPALRRVPIQSKTKRARIRGRIPRPLKVARNIRGQKSRVASRAWGGSYLRQLSRLRSSPTSSTFTSSTSAR